MNAPSCLFVVGHCFRKVPQSLHKNSGGRPHKTTFQCFLISPQVPSPSLASRSRPSLSTGSLLSAPQLTHRAIPVQPPPTPPPPLPLSNGSGARDSRGYVHMHKSMEPAQVEAMIPAEEEAPGVAVESTRDQLLIFVGPGLAPIALHRS
jgi:hypothetical protein